MFEKRIMTSKNKQNIMKHENLLRNTGEGGIIYSTHCAIWQCMLDNFSVDKKRRHETTVMCFYRHIFRIKQTEHKDNQIVLRKIELK